MLKHPNIFTDFLLSCTNCNQRTARYRCTRARGFNEAPTASYIHAHDYKTACGNRRRRRVEGWLLVVGGPPRGLLEGSLLVVRPPRRRLRWRLDLSLHRWLANVLYHRSSNYFQGVNLKMSTVYATGIRTKLLISWKMSEGPNFTKFTQRITETAVIV